MSPTKTGCFTAKSQIIFCREEDIFSRDRK